MTTLPCGRLIQVPAFQSLGLLGTFPITSLCLPPELLQHQKSLTAISSPPAALKPLNLLFSLSLSAILLRPPSPKLITAALSCKDPLSPELLFSCSLPGPAQPSVPPSAGAAKQTAVAPEAQRPVSRGSSVPPERRHHAYTPDTCASGGF